MRLKNLLDTRLVLFWRGRERRASAAGATFGLCGYCGAVSVAAGERGDGVRWMKVADQRFGGAAVSLVSDPGKHAGRELRAHGILHKVSCWPSVLPPWGQVGFFCGEGGLLREKASRSWLQHVRAATWEFVSRGLQYMCANKTEFSNLVLYEPACL